jgi:hypothetical protein
MRGTDMMTFPFFVKVHMETSRASSMLFSVARARAMLLEKVSSTSCRLLASGRGAFGNSKVSGTTAAAILSGPDALKRAHLDRRPTGDDSLAPPRQCLIQVGGFQNPKTAYVAPWSPGTARR